MLSFNSLLNTLFSTQTAPTKIHVLSTAGYSCDAFSLEIIRHSFSCLSNSHPAKNQVLYRNSSLISYKLFFPCFSDTFSDNPSDAVTLFFIPATIYPLEMCCNSVGTGVTSPSWNSFRLKLVFQLSARNKNLLKASFHGAESSDGGKLKFSLFVFYRHSLVSVEVKASVSTLPLS